MHPLTQVYVRNVITHSLVSPDCPVSTHVTLCLGGFLDDHGYTNITQRMYIGRFWLGLVGNLTIIHNKSEKGRPFPLSVGEMGYGN